MDGYKRYQTFQLKANFYNENVSEHLRLLPHLLSSALVTYETLVRTMRKQYEESQGKQ